MITCIKCGTHEDGSFFNNVCAQCDFEDWIPTTGGSTDSFGMGVLCLILVGVPGLGALYAIGKVLLDLL